LLLLLLLLLFFLFYFILFYFILFYFILFFYFMLLFFFFLFYSFQFNLIFSVVFYILLMFLFCTGQQSTEQGKLIANIHTQGSKADILNELSKHKLLVTTNAYDYVRRSNILLHRSLSKDDASVDATRSNPIALAQMRSIQTDRSSHKNTSTIESTQRKVSNKCADQQLHVTSNQTLKEEPSKSDSQRRRSSIKLDSPSASGNDESSSSENITRKSITHSDVSKQEGPIVKQRRGSMFSGAGIAAPSTEGKKLL
jgi:signal transduction histidine kinase